MSAPKPVVDRNKMEHVILFFLERINNIRLGRTKLMKLLYYVDFDHYEKHRRSVTNARYRKLPHGPYPDKIEDLIDAMVQKGAVQQVVTKVQGFKQRRLITTAAKFDASLFKGDELQTLELVAEKWADASAGEIEAATHREAPWASTEDRKMIDYELAEYRKPLPKEPLDDWLAKSAAFAKYVAQGS